MEHGPAVPTYILRGHVATIHALHFYSHNTFLASGDSDGWIVIWSISSKRPVAVWKAHEGGIMQIRDWSHTRLVTHGRDHKLRVWQVRSPDDIGGLSTRLPADGASPDQAQPWLIHSLSINALNFCPFSLCDEDVQQLPAGPQLIASPNGLDSGGIDIFQLPSEHRVSQIHSSDQGAPTPTPKGMVMAVSLFHDATDPSRLILVSGYEDGRVMVHCHRGPFSSSESQWQRLTMSKPHSQPVLSIATNAARTHFVTSGADAIIAKFPVPVPVPVAGDDRPEKTVNTKHAGQQGLSVRSDDKIFATAGWDGRVRVYSSKTMAELAVLKWHKLGCYATAFAHVNVGNNQGSSVEGAGWPSSSSTTDVTAPVNALDLIKQQREQKARLSHWLAAGGKDGKISLWDIY